MIHIPDQGEVLRHYGGERQSLIAAEELAELIQAVSKMRRIGSEDVDTLEAYFEIGKGLTADGIKTAAGNERWGPSTLKKILSNEKYIGDALLQKTVTTDFLTKKRVINKGIAPQYYVEGSHEPIIPKELYTMVQEEMARRANLRGVNGKRHIYSGKYALSNTVYCAHCGDVFQRTHWNIHGRKKIVWRCISRLRSKETEFECKSRTIDETELHQVVVAAVNEVFEQKDGYIDHLKKNVEKVLSEESDDHTGFVIENDEAVDDGKYLEKEDRLIYENSVDEIQSLPELESKLTELQQEVLQKTRAGENTDDLKAEIDRLQERKYVLQIETARIKGIRRRIQDLEEYLNEPVMEYDDSLVRKLIERITVYDDRCDVEFKSGIIVEVYIPYR